MARGALLQPMPGSLLRATVPLLAATVLLLPAPGLALDLTGSLRTSAEWDSNVARVDGSQNDDFIFRFQPEVELRQDRGKFQWLVNYRFPYDIAVETSDLDGFRHFLRANGEYNLSERTRFFVSNRFSKSDAVSNTNLADGSPSVNSFDVPVYRNRVTGGVRHSLTQRTQGTLSFTHSYVDTDLPNRSTVNTFVGNGSVSYSLDPRHNVGGGMRASYQDFSENNLGTRPPRQALFLNFFASWSWIIDESTTLSIQAGPTYVSTNQDAPPTLQSATAYFSNVRDGALYVIDPATCPGGGLVLAEPTACQLPGLDDGAGGITGTRLTDPDEIVEALTAQNVVGFLPGQDPSSNSDSSWDVFAEVSLSRRWKPNHLTSVSYQRSDSATSGLGSSVRDFVALIHDWQITEKWNAGVRGEFTRRELVSPIREIFPLVGAGVLDQGTPAAETLAVGVREVSRNVSTMRWSVRTNLDRRITRHLRAGLRYSYNKQQSDSGTSARLSDFDDHIITVGIQYDFDRYSLDRYIPW